jgi:hypothetical protein
MVTTIDQVVRAMGGAFLRGEGVYFVGSGISAGSGLPDWLGLISDIANPLGLIVTKNDDLPRIAQYCINADHGNRGPLIGRLKRALSPHVQRPNPYHRAISRTNVTTIWTTNFDTLLESALATTRLAVRASDADLTGGTRDFDVELLKVHGCIDRSKADELVLTQEDYENFSTRRPALAERLRHDLIHHSLLFLGYGYGDPNIATTLVEARRLSGGATREHYFITMRETDPQALQRQELWHSDLRRFGMRTAFITAYDELSTALDGLALASCGKSVFVTGSHAQQSVLAADVGRLLAAIPDVVLLDGQSSGIGRDAANAFGTTCVQRHIDIRERIRFFPNPYSFDPAFANNASLLGTLKQWRVSLARAAHSIIVFDGGMGTDTEVEVARELGCIIVPVMGTTNGTGNRLLNDPEVVQRLDANYVSTAKSGKATAKDIVDCLLETFPQ